MCQCTNTIWGVEPFIGNTRRLQRLNTIGEFKKKNDVNVLSRESDCESSQPDWKSSNIICILLRVRCIKAQRTSFNNNKLIGPTTSVHLSNLL